MARYIDISGSRFGFLLVKRYSHTIKKSDTVWECICDCGNVHFCSKRNLHNGSTKSCGCWKRKVMTDKYKDVDVKTRFEQYVFYSPDGCHYWIGSCNGAYAQKHKRGIFNFNGKNTYAPRVAYELYIGTIPPHLSVCHSCDNPLCVNPYHLFLGTHYENMVDMAMKGKKASKLTLDDVARIRALGGSTTHSEIAQKFGVNRTMVTRILNGTRRSHV